MRPDPCRPINIVGAGLAGPLLALMLARRGFSVVLYEKRSDPRRVRTQRGRSINLTLAARGINALERAGVMSTVASRLIPMRGRMVHTTSRRSILQLYGQREHEVIYSIQRVVLQRILIEETARYPNITIRFDQQCIAADPKENRLTFRDKTHGKEYSVELAPTIATDGANSAVRASLVERGYLAACFDMLDHGYKELTLPSFAGGYALNSDALHLWPRGDFMLVAMPNLNCNMTATLFLKNTGPVSFAALKDSQGVSEFFNREFPDAVPRIQNLTEQFSSNPQSRLGTVSVKPWQTLGAVLLLGDAAHAIVPFYGQGVNAAFEDCVVFDSLLDKHEQWAPLFLDFEKVRRADTNAIAQMSLENYMELSAAVLQPDFVLRKFLELELERRFPDRFIPQYSMVTFHPEISYAQAQQRGKIQEDILAELTLGESKSAQHRLGITDFALAARLIHEKLPVLACGSAPNNDSSAKWHDISRRPELIRS
ncbi:FAD-dependent monooxygenase (plasmid) [Eleftheria terrae]|nr:NAD(P)/FAD-dependent oxidoreductase [Eleftheria terrae]WKB56060.1 FAD-dependent monooxygenase [Eleftheria terrae]